jgi:excisionase family DNA binding protein
MPREGVLGQATRIDPVPADHEALDSLRAREDLGGGELVLRTADGTEISLPSSLLRLVVSAASNLAAGRAVMTIPAEVTLTPTEAAELLGLSRPFVARLLERGDIPSELLPREPAPAHQAGRRARLPTSPGAPSERTAQNRRHSGRRGPSLLILTVRGQGIHRRVRPVPVLRHGWSA